MKLKFKIIIGIVILFVIFIFLRSNEDSWIKDDTGEYAEHGVPSNIPDYVIEQTNAISCALNLYKEKKAENMIFDSQCLGTCDKFAVDIVHVPRNTDDDIKENQCLDYVDGKVSNFIELDQEGSIFRIE